FTLDGELTGFDVEMGAALAEAMGLEVNPLNMDFNGLIPALQGGRIDFINSAMYINDERAQQVDFVPYMLVGNEIVVATGNPAGIGGREDLCGMTVAVTLGAIEEIYAREDAARCEAAGEETVEVMTLPTAQDSVLAVRQGRADAFGRVGKNGHNRIADGFDNRPVVIPNNPLQKGKLLPHQGIRSRISPAIIHRR
ncbi:MAG: transporter substrate-binding domain-containing protein, partial [Anaerolineales bacterium]|nr:transporter substrate-binding domain-containing protein [Anaerolineales bacterium]